MDLSARLSPHPFHSSVHHVFPENNCDGKGCEWLSFQGMLSAPLLKMNLKTLSQEVETDRVPGQCGELCSESWDFTTGWAWGRENQLWSMTHGRRGQLAVSFSLCYSLNIGSMLIEKVSPLVGAVEAISVCSPSLLRRHSLSHLLTQPSPAANTGTVSMGCYWTLGVSILPKCLLM